MTSGSPGQRHSRAATLRTPPCFSALRFGPCVCDRGRTPSRLPAGTTFPGRLSGVALRRATRPQPNVAPNCHRHCPKYAPSVQQPHGDGRFEGADRVEVRHRGADFHEGGHGGGTTGVAKRCAGVTRPSTGISGGTDDPSRRTFRSLKLLIHLRHHPRQHPWPCPSGRPGVPLHPPAFSPQRADLGHLVEPPAHP